MIEQNVTQAAQAGFDIWDWLNSHPSAQTGMWGLAGGIIHVAFAQGGDAPMKKGTICGTLLSGMCFGAFGPEVISWTGIELPPASAGLAGLVVGLLGMKIAKSIIEGKLPWTKT